MYTIVKFFLLLCIVFLIYIISSYIYDKLQIKNVENLVSVIYNENKIYNRGRGYPDIVFDAPIAYEKMGNTIKYPDKIIDKDEITDKDKIDILKDKINSLKDKIYDNNFNQDLFISENNKIFYNDETVYDDLMNFNSASNSISNFKHNFNEAGGYFQ